MTTLYELFEEQVKKTPDQIALVYKNRTMTYEELDKRANQLAVVLREKGVKSEIIVAIMVRRSIEMVIAIMATMKAGGAYVPIDPEYPTERIQYILSDTQAKILLAQDQIADKIHFHGKMLPIDDEQLYTEISGTVKSMTTSKDLAYIIYTSGSTGEPKGVMIEHRSIVNSILWRKNEYQLNVKDTVLQLFSYSFDGFLTSLFTPLVSGSKVVLLSETDAKDPLAIKHCLIEKEITHFICVPTLYAAILECIAGYEMKNLKMVTLAGEKVTISLVQRSKEKMPHLELINEYGPTENSVVTTYFRNIQNMTTITIGKPISNTHVYVLNENLESVPAGTSGELCISGIGLARGYLNRKELTAQRFIPNPFQPNERLYKTGDIVRYLPDGHIEFLHRLDEQVKIRGYRIEVEEIVHHLENHDAVSKAIVVANQNGEDETTLWAYMVLKEPIEVDDMKDYLTNHLPFYMIPQYFIPMDHIPLTSSGKVNKRALPKPAITVIPKVRYNPPENEMEKKLIKIWENILRKKPIGRKDHFFRLGGHSLNAMMLISHIYKEIQVEMPLSEVFKHPTIEEQAAFIKNADVSAYLAIQPIEEQEFYPLSSAQKRIFVSNEREGANLCYNLPTFFIVEGKIQKQRLENILNTLIKRHAQLRASFDLVDGKIMQKIDENIRIQINMDTDEEDQLNNRINQFIRPFRLNKAPLFRVKIIHFELEKYLFMLDIHHIIFDGVSMSILIHEFLELYKGEKLPKLQVQYKDFTHWHHQLLRSKEIKKQEKYWLNIFTKPVPKLNMPTDYPFPRIKSYLGDKVTFKLGVEATQKLSRLVSRTNTTTYMVLLAVYNVVLSKYTGEKDIVIGSPVAGRNHPELDKIIGMFVNTLAMRNYPEKDKKFIDFLKEVRDRTLAAFKNQDYQLEALIDQLELGRDGDRNPLFNVLFVMQNMNIPDVIMEGIKVTPYSWTPKVAEFDMTLLVEEKDHYIELGIVYSTQIFSQETMKRFGKHFIQTMKVILENPSIRLSDIDMVSQEEKNQIIKDFNDTKKEYGASHLLHQLFEQQVEKTPDSIAVEYKNKEMTYKELNNRANQLAKMLRQKGVGPEEIVGIMLAPSFEMVVAILGILKAGGAYVPIDPQYPTERISFMLSDSGIKVLLTDKELLGSIHFEGECIYLTFDKLEYEEVTNLQHINSPKDLAYIIYTSGSTGKPKGVMVEHKNISNTIQWRKDEYQLKDKDVILQLFSYSFDGFLTSFFTPIVSGAKVILLDEMATKDPIAIKHHIIEKKVTHFICVPTLFSPILDCLTTEQMSSLKIVTLAGEKAWKNLIRKAKEQCPSLEIVNEYGPTENSVATTIYRNMQKACEIKIGRPIANTKIYIMSQEGHLQPIGIPGELCISGYGIARGYLNREDLIREKFMMNPFEKGEILYRTGDLARWLPDGNIEFFGRMGNQIKLRGYRIELEEIENTLLKHPSIEEVAVVDRTGENRMTYLCAYYVSHRGECSQKELRNFLSNQLPKFMIPSYFIRIKKLPVTPNGKLNKKALPEPDKNSIVDEQFTAPASKVEEELSKIWAEVLGVDKGSISVYDNFFDRGGNSILLIKMYTYIEKKYPGKVKVAELFLYSTIKWLAQFIDRDGEQVYQQVLIERIPFPEDYLLKSWDNEESSVFNFKLEGPVMENLHLLANEEKVDSSDILLAMYMYLLAEVSNKQEIKIQTMLDHVDKVIPIKINLNTMTDTSSLLQAVKEQRLTQSETDGYRIHDITNYIPDKKKNLIAPFIYSKGLLSPNFLDILNTFDILISLSEEKDGIAIGCTYNGNRMKKEKMKGFIFRYMELIELLIS